MGSDPLLGASPFLAPAVLAVLQLALAVTILPVLRAHRSGSL